MNTPGQDPDRRRRQLWVDAGGLVVAVLSLSGIFVGWVTGHPVSAVVATAVLVPWFGRVAAAVRDGAWRRGVLLTAIGTAIAGGIALLGWDEADYQVSVVAVAASMSATAATMSTGVTRDLPVPHAVAGVVALGVTGAIPSAIWGLGDPEVAAIVWAGTSVSLGTLLQTWVCFDFPVEPVASRAGLSAAHWVRTWMFVTASTATLRR